MISRDRVKLSIQHKEPDRLPRYDSFWEDTVSKWVDSGSGQLLSKEDIVLNHDGSSNAGLSLQNALGFDINLMHLDNSFRLDAQLLGNDGEKLTVKDRCGYTAEKFIGKSRTLHMFDHVTCSQEDWDRNKKRLVVDVDEFSRIDDTAFFMRYEPSPTWDEASWRFKKMYANDKYTMLSSYGPVEASWRHRGYTEFLMDTVLNESLISEMFEMHTDLIIETMKKGFEYGIVPDGYFLVEDLGHTRGLLFSPDVYKKLVSPCHRKLGDFLHSKNIDFLMHSCGKVKELIPYFIDEGLDVLQAIEAKADQHVVSLKKEFGKDMAYMGNIDVRQLSGSKEDIDTEINEKIIPAMKGGGYIYHSDHSVPPEISLDNYTYLMKKLDNLTY